MTDAPILFRWNAERETMEPLSRFIRRCNETFVDGETYRMSVAEERSLASHNHFFAHLHEMWLSLPDAIAVQFPTVETLRKHALIMTGFRRERKFVASSKEEARKLAAFLKPQNNEDDYAIISVSGSVVIEWKAMSQSRKAMPEKGQFHRSKQAVLDWVSDLLNTERDAA